ncbi:glycoside hydrolase family 130 protein [Cohnella abietis]|uniref:Glycosylase n=1 Tax=Cohnella abietis TaxID=2507935 RepID=A0A3T1D1J6_9BACL|nr:glycoside hydrolase family 130 protein [Cohnella abietis]BBI31966.1 glycosylase [Cohnella abietis]
MKPRILTKYANNPIMSPAQMPIDVLYTFNPGAIKYKGEYILMMDVTTLDDIHRIWISRSKDGYQFVPDPEPVKWPAPDPAHPETCTYDPRITQISENEYIILYASDLSQNDVRIGILRTSDFVNFERITTGSELGNRNGALFPEKVDNLYIRFDRPFGNELNPSYIWVSYSPDLVFWGKSKPLTYQGNPFRDGYKMGAGAVPIKTEQGWLEIYHTVSQTCNGFIYRLKACLLDLDDPSRVIGFTRDFLLWPEHDYEMKGRVSNVVFTCNAILEDDGMVKIYYGAADTNIGLAEGNLQEIIQACV